MGRAGTGRVLRAEMGSMGTFVPELTRERRFCPT
jgi:hypothetical protein